jgi:succinyl-CoA synthetase alpha subunit
MVGKIDPNTEEGALEVLERTYKSPSLDYAKGLYRCRRHRMSPKEALISVLEDGTGHVKKGGHFE